MKLQIITQTTGRSGRVMQQKKLVQGDWIRVGRAASSEIHLADPRVALNQGLIMDRGGIVYTEGEAGIVNPGSTTRKAVKSVRLKAGASIEVGPYKFTALEPPAGFDGAITIELVRPLEAATTGDIRSRAEKLSLASLHLPKFFEGIVAFEEFLFIEKHYAFIKLSVKLIFCFINHSES